MRLIHLVLVVTAILGLTSAAVCAETSVVARINGEASVVRVSNEGDWLAAWSKKPDGTFTLYSIYEKNGDTKVVDQIEDAKIVDITNPDGEPVAKTLEKGPGGICWIPGKSQLLYCTSEYMDRLKTRLIRYYIYNTSTKKSRKLIDLSELEEMYMFDPIAAEDGSKIVHVTINGELMPSFNIFHPDSEMITPMPVSTNSFGSEWDLSSDGNTAYWYGHQDNGNFCIIGYNLLEGRYTKYYEFSKHEDWAQDHAMLRINTPFSQAATIGYHENNPTLQLCVYDFSNPLDPFTQPVYLDSNEQVEYFDWKGRSSKLFALIKNTATNEYSIEEIEPLLNERKVLHKTTDEIMFVDYSPVTKAYYYTVVNDRNKSKTSTLIMRLQ